MIEPIDPTAQFLAAKKAEGEARAVLEKRLAEIRAEKKAAHAKWSAEEKRIRELLRVKKPFTRKPKLEAAPVPGEKKSA